MKRLLVASCFLLAALGMSAQNVVTGTVTDKSGNPIPGAKVEIVGSTESVITELDGTFRLESQSEAVKVRVYYAGMRSKVQKVEPDMVIRLSEISWWNNVPEKYDWFIAVQGVFPDVEDMGGSAYGLMVGQVKEFGWYAKGVFMPAKSTDGEYYGSPFGSDDNRWKTGEASKGLWAATAGVMYRMWSPIHVYAGAGWLNRKVAWEMADGTWLKHEDYSYDGPAIDLGLMVRLGKFTVNAGCMIATDGTSGMDTMGNFGIGYSF